MLMGLPTTFGSHLFDHVSLTHARHLKKKLDVNARNSTAATDPSKWDMYLSRVRYAKDVDQSTLLDVGFASASAPLGSTRPTADELETLSFTDFYRKFRFVSAGRGRRGEHGIHRRAEPTVVVVKPRMHPSWGRPGHPKRAEYCRIKLQQFMPFDDEHHFERYVHGTHRGDYESAYEEFAVSDPAAPECCRDDFTDLLIEEDGPEARAQPAAADNAEFCMYAVNPQFEAVCRRIDAGGVDWVARSKERYTPEQIVDSGRWLSSAVSAAADADLSRSSSRESGFDFDVAGLNDGQRLPFAVIADHVVRSEAAPCAPLRMLVLGTAGSGKTFLVRGLKILLGDRCIVLAPTGVAADNIGGCTLHSQLPLPVKNLDREAVRVNESSPRYARLIRTWRLIRYVIIDEISMVGRRMLGHIDELCRQAKGIDDWFGGMSVILVGDHGQLPPVKDRRVYDWAGVMYTCKGRYGQLLRDPPKFQLRGIRAYQQFTLVFFLDTIMRVDASSDAAESAKLASFKQLQLRARDGELTKSDWQHMREQHAFDRRAANFNRERTYYLVTKRADRDAMNARRLAECIDAGVPAARLDAIHRPDEAATLDDDEFGLVKELYLCVGARVMITHNLSVKMGLCNGTQCTVYDIVCGESGVATSVLVAVRRSEPGFDGYSGPTFLDDAPGIDSARVAIVAVARHTVLVYEGGQALSRSQFPLQLSWVSLLVARLLCGSRCVAPVDACTCVGCGCGVSGWPVARRL